MLWRPYRLRKVWQFKDLITKGQKVFNPSFTIFFTSNNHNNCRFGIATPKKLIKLAVDRNFYRRQVRAMLISHLKSSLKKKANSCQASTEHSHSDLVIIIRYPYLKNEFITNQANLYKLLNLIEAREKQSNHKN
jgi:ribonuclease P protein component